MGVLSIIATIPIIAIEVCALILAIEYNGVGPALEPPAHLDIYGRVAYYTFHRRFRDFFVPFYTFSLIYEAFHFFEGDMWGPLWVNNLFFLSGSWLWSLTMTRMEAVHYRNKPYTADEEKLWTEGMTRREFLRRKFG